MAFELHPDESARRGLRRLARKELRSALDQIGSGRPDEEAIHQARRSVKKVRAMIRLIDADGGRKLARAERRLRDVNRTLSSVRDADAMLETLSLVKKAHPDLFSEHGYARLRRQFLMRKKEITLTAGRKAVWKDARRQMRMLRKWASGWRTDHRGFGALAPGMRRISKLAHDARDRALRTHDAVDFHEWRKEIKALWYALRLIGGGSAAIARDIRALHSAERWLGDDHNLVVMGDMLSEGRSVCSGPVDVQRVRCAVEQMQHDLRRRALERTDTVFAIRPRDYVARIERAWRARRRGRRSSARTRAA